jgi:hypothetical protein
MKKKLYFIILCLSGILIFIKTPLKASTFYVNTTEDQVEGSLRQAISIANSNNEDDTIYLPAGTYILQGTPDEDANTSGDLDINTIHSITIVGDGSGITSIEGNGADRVLHILKGTVSITGVTIRNGKFRCPENPIDPSDLPNFGDPHGGGIYNNGTLTLKNCTVSNNRSKKGCYYLIWYGQNLGWGKSDAGHGGGIYNKGTLSLFHCSVSNNTAEAGLFYHMVYSSSGNGGGIYNEGTLYLSDCWLEENRIIGGGSCGSLGLYGHGAGIFNSGTMNLSTCTITNNSTGNGRETMESHITYGEPGGYGGGIFNQQGKATLSYCTISYNKTGDGGSAEYTASGGSGGGIYNEATLIINNSDIVNNSTGNAGEGIFSSGWGGFGGGILNAKGSATLTNCTISGNSTGEGSISSNEPAGEGGYGAGIYNAAELSLKSCTVSCNVTGKGGDNTTGGPGGGIYCSENGIVYLRNTIIGDNQVSPGGEAPDIWGSLNSQGYNLIENTDNCTIIGDSSGNITGVDPALAPLADNGGPTRTHALLINSPAVDAGTSAGISIDQRGYARPKDMPGIINVNDGADIGAFELSTPYSISGRITCDNTGLPGVTLTFSNSAGATFTDSNGDYSHPVEPGWSGTVTPSKEDYTFTPSSRSYTSVAAVFTHQDYTASPFPVSVTITHPENGATVSGTVTIAAAVSSNARAAGIQAVTKVEFYIDGTIKGEVTSSPFQYDWNTGLSGNGEHTIKAKAYNEAYQSGEDEITVTVSNTPYISVNRSLLNFRELTNGANTYQQEFTITNSGSGILNWTIRVDRNWLSCSPTSGTNSAVIMVSVPSSSDHRPGTYTGTITIESPDADNSPQTVTVNLTVSRGSVGQPPFGSFDTPIANTTVMSSVPFTGWVLDDINIESVKIYREPVTGEGNGPVYIGNALFVEGARPDIEQQYPDYPGNYKAGWGYMMLTNFLPDGGNGYFTFHVKATDWEEQTVTLGTKTVFCDNQNAVKPFGAIDTPVQGGTASGSDFVNFGWVLTPLPNTIPKDGSTINVWVDGVPLGNPVYNRYRSDIADLFPAYNNSDGAVGYYYLDTTKYKNGVHTIAWSAADDAGNADGIGSRYFSILNSETAAASKQSAVFNVNPDRIPINDSLPVWIKKGYNPDDEPIVVYPDDEGILTIKIEELECLEIHFFDPTLNIEPRTLNSSWLPIGSTLDRNRGIFYWQPGPGFIGDYYFVFIRKEQNGEMSRININVRINPIFVKPGPGVPQH